MKFDSYEFPNTDTGNTLRELVEQGSDINKPMDLDFFISVTNEESGKLISRDVMGLDYRVSLEMDSEMNEWTCYCAKTMIPKYEDIIRIEEELDEIAKRHGGYIDGFGSFGNAE